ncbi:MAG TPA: PAS domain-containing protein [Solimonas sp.]|nr:PAS domain-containing protein [Solimonas sp.]
MKRGGIPASWIWAFAGLAATCAAHAATRVDLTPAEQQWVAEHPVVRISAVPDWTPIDFVDESGERAGISPEVVQLLGQRLGLRFEWHNYAKWEEALEAAQRRDVDVLSTLGYAPEREEFLVFTRPYLRFRSVIVVRDDVPFIGGMEELAHARFVLGRGYAETTVFTERFPDYAYTLVPSIRDALAAVASGEADATIGNVAVVSHTARALGLSNLRVAAPFVTEERTIHFGVRRDWPELATIIDKALLTIPPAQLAQIQNRWITIGSQGGVDPATIWKGVAAAAAALLLIAAVVVLWGRGLRRELEYRRISEARIEGAQRLLREVTDKIPNGVVYQFARLRNGELKANFVSDGIKPLTGLERNDVLRNYLRIFDSVVEEDRPRLIAAVEASSRSMVAYEVDYRVRTPDGVIDWVRGSAVPRPGPDGSVIWNGFATRISELKRVEAEIRAAQQQLESITESLPGTVYRSERLPDGTMRYTFVTDAANDLFGVSREAILADFRALHDLMDPDTRRAVVETFMAAVAQQHPVQVEFQIRRPDGQLRWMRTRATPRTVAPEHFAWVGFTMDITAEREAKDQVEEVQRRLQQVTDNVPGSVFQLRREAGSALRFTYVSSGVERLLGRTRQQVLDNFDGMFAQVHEDDRALVMQTIQQSADTLKAMALDFRIHHHDGRVLWIQTMLARPEREGDTLTWSGYWHNVTERRELMAQLADARQQVVELARSLPGVVYQSALHRDGSVELLFNGERYFQLLGLEHTSNTMDYRRVFEVVHEDDREPLFDALTESAHQMTPITADFRVCAPGLPVRWVRIEAVAKPGHDHDVVAIWNGYGLDITERKLLEQELAKARDAAEAANRAKGEFLANMSHEIRTPMNAIIGLSHLAQRTNPEPRLRDYVDKIQSSAQSLLGILNDILDFSKIEAGKLGLEHTPFRLDDVLSNLVNVIGLRAYEKNLELLFRVPLETPLQMIGDPLRLGQVLLNLTANAVKFTETGQVVVSLREVRREEKQCWIEFAVIDSGIGMSPEQRGRLFQSFTQADASTTRKYGGTGLGLTISRRLTEMMGGVLEVDSELDKGSTFRFIIPLELAAEVREPLRADKELAGAPVALVDDNVAACEIIGLYLRSFGFEVRTASAAGEALHQIARADQAGHGYRLVLFDWNLEGVGGLAFARQVRELPLTQKPALIAVSAYGREDVGAQVTEHKLDGLLLKPVNPSSLLDAIMQALGHGAAVRPHHRVRQLNLQPGSLTGFHGLIVEDNKINQQVVCELLEDAGAKVTIANNGAEALEMAQRGDYSFVLMDLQMPVMDGITATREIRGAGCMMPIIAMTASAMPGDRERCLEAGMNDYLSKPIDLEKLASALVRWLQIKPAEVEEPAPLEVAPGEFDRAQVGLLLRRLEGQLDASDSAAVDTLEALGSALNGARPRALRDLGRMVEGFNFRAAKGQLAGVRSQLGLA